MQDTDAGDGKMQKDTSIEKEWVIGAMLPPFTLPTP